jgi:hypothetical protein
VAGIHASAQLQPAQVCPQRLVGLPRTGGHVIGVQSVNVGSVHPFGLGQVQQVCADFRLAPLRILRILRISGRLGAQIRSFRNIRRHPRAIFQQIGQRTH